MIGELKLEEAAYFDFVTHHPSTAAVTDADSGPTAEVFEDATDTTVVALTVTKRTSKTGDYRVPVTAAAASGFEVDKTYNVVASATVNGITGKGIIGRFKVRARGKDDLAYPATSGRSIVVDASGLVDANAVKIGPTGAGTAQTARDIGTSVLLSSGTGTGQVSLSAGAVLLQATQTGVTIPTVTTLTNAPSALADIQSRLPAALSNGFMKASIQEVANGINGLVRAGTAQAVGATSLTMDAAASYADNVLIGNTAKLTSGTYAGATGIVTANVGSTDVLTIGGGWSGGVTPTGTPTFELYSSAAGAGVAQTGDAYAIVASGAYGNAALKTLIDTVSTNVSTVVTRIPAALFSGITSLAHWIGMLAGKQAANATALTELKASGAGSGTYDPTTDSLEAVRDNVGTAGAGLTAADDAVITAIGALNNLSQANIRTAVGLGSANLDTQLDALPTNAELATALGTADDAVLAALAALNNVSAADVLAQVSAALTATVADSIPADGSRPSVASGVYLIVQYLLERSVSGTTATIKKPDGSTTLLTQQLNSSTAPTSVTRLT